MKRAVLLLALAGCEPIASLDLHYAKDAGADADAQDDASTADAPSPDAAASGACPCDTTAGLGCCLRANAEPSCVALASDCAGGSFVACTRADPLSDSVCCWSQVEGTNVAALSATCGARASACTSDADCKAGARCNTTTCHGFVVGACDVAPICP